MLIRPLCLLIQEITEMNRKHSIQKELCKFYWSYKVISLDVHNDDYDSGNNSSSFQVKEFWSHSKAIKKGSTSI